MLQLTITHDGLTNAHDILAKMAGFDLAELTDDVGALLESGAKGRFVSKESPDGTAWPQWSESYAATRHGGQSLLMNDGDLEEDVQNYSSGLEAKVGASLPYARRQQLGDTDPGIPARAFLGMSEADEVDINDLVIGRLKDLFQ